MTEEIEEIESEIDTDMVVDGEGEDGSEMTEEVDLEIPVDEEE